MENLIKIDTVDQYNKMFGLETLHPLVSVVDLSKSETWPTNFRVNYGIYGLFLKDTKCGDIRYGRQYYDYQEGTVVGFAPGQVTGIELKDGTRLWDGTSSVILSSPMNQTRRYISLRKRRGSSWIA